MATEDDTAPSGTKRIPCTLSLATIRYLEALSKKGTHGKGVSKVMTTLIEEGVRRAILDKNVRIPEGAIIGYDLERDRGLYQVTESGIVVVEGHRSQTDVSSLQL